MRVIGSKSSRVHRNNSSRGSLVEAENGGLLHWFDDWVGEGIDSFLNEFE